MTRQSTRRCFLEKVGGVALLGTIGGCIGAAEEKPEPTNGTDATDGLPRYGDGTTTSAESPDNTTADSDKEDEEAESKALAPPENGAVVFVYDDGPIQDYTQAFPVHQEFDAPASTGIVTEWIGRQNFMNNDWMDVDHLEELAAAGWEIMSHTTEHTALGTFELVRDAEPVDRLVYPAHFRHGYHHGKDLVVTDGEHRVVRTVVDHGTNDTGYYIELDDPVGEVFPAGETIVRYPPEQMHEALAASKRTLERLGFEVDTLLAPYDNFDAYSMEFVPEYYAGVANATHGTRINAADGFNPYQTHRDYFIEFTDRTAVKQDLDAIAERGALGVFGAHTFKDDVTPERIRETLEWIDARDIEVLTLRDAIERFTDDRS